MAGDNVEALTATIATLSLAQPTGGIPIEIIDEPSSSNSLQGQVDESSGQKIARAKEAQSSNANNDDTPTNNTTRARKDSHSGNDNDDLTNDLLEINGLKSEIETLKQQNKGLKRKAARYKVEMEKAHSENCSTKKELENKESDLVDCQQKLESAEKLNRELRCLYSMEHINFEKTTVVFDNVKFEKTYNDNYSTKFTLKAEFKTTLSTNLIFPYKTWKDKKTGKYCRGHDDGAIAFVEISRQLYAAKCGKEQENYDGFIDKEHWTKEVMILSRVIGLELEWGWAQHAELQLIAFCITQFLEERGFSMADLENPTVYQAGPKPRAPVEIYVSQPPCEECRGFIDRIHDVVGKHGWDFKPVNRRHYGSLEIGQRTRPSFEYLV